MSLSVTVHPLDSVPNDQLIFVVIAARCSGRLLFCKHRRRSTWECPGGHIEAGETPREAAMRELFEETGCMADPLEAVCIYSVQSDGGAPTYGMLFRAEVSRLGDMPNGFEMECIQLFDQPPEAWTYPDIQPFLLEQAWADKTQMGLQ